MNYQTIFKNNKYTKWYLSILEKYSVDDSGESHHIIPRSCGGDNSKNNIRRITTRAHLLCHLLLPKMLLHETHIKSMVYARRFMIDLHHKKTTKYIEKCRQEAFLNRSELLKNKPNNFSRKEVMEKCHKTRMEKGTNPFVTNNPMRCEDSKNKKIEKTSGEKHYTKKKKSYKNILSGEYKYFEYNPGNEWILEGVSKFKPKLALRKPKPRYECVYCHKFFPQHTMNRHIKSRHENKKD